MPELITGSATAAPILANDLAQRIEQAARDAEGADAPNTVRTYRNAMRDLERWAEETGRSSALPLTGRDLAAYVDARAADGKAPATVRTYVAAFNRMHRDLGLPVPGEGRVARLALRRMGRAAAERGHRQRQAEPMRLPHIDAALGRLGDSLTDLRDAALICLAFDTLLRASELVALRVADVQPQGRDGVCYVARSKTDQEGRGDVRFVSRSTLARVRGWLSAARLEADSPLFIPLSNASRAERLTPRDVSRIFQRRVGEDFTAHSSRVGAAVEQREAGVPTGLIAQSGGWRSEAMVARYTQHIAAQ